MASKLAIYNDALGMLGERKLAGLTEDREPRRVLDDFWDGVVLYALERGFWNFAMRTKLIDSSASYDPAFGFTFAFEKPSDWVRTYVIADNDHLQPPLMRYVDEGGFWYADVDPLYVRFVSSDVEWGRNLSLWPESFSEYVSDRLAVKACKRITGGNPSDDMLASEKRSLGVARSRDAMDEPAGFPPTGSWVNSRGSSGVRSRWDRRAF